PRSTLFPYTTLFRSLLARTAVEGGEAGFDGAAESFAVHVADHQDAAGAVILDDRRDQSVGLGKIEFHANSNKKARHKAWRASFLISISVESGQRPPHVDWTVVMVMTGGGGHKGRV